MRCSEDARDDRPGTRIGNRTRLIDSEDEARRCCRRERRCKLLSRARSAAALPVELAGCGEAVARVLQDARAAGENRALPGCVGGTEHFEKLPLDRPRLLRIGVTMEL